MGGWTRGVGPVLAAGAVVLVLQAGMAATSLAAAGAAGLVLKVAGPVQPALSPYGEVADNTPITLGNGGKVTLVHYGTCRQLAIAGGRITVGSKEVTLADGAVIEKESPGKCPAELRVKAAGVAGGVRMRAVMYPELPGVPRCALVGAGADTFVTARVSENGTLVAEAPIRGRVMMWPANQTPLTARETYDLDLQPPPGGRPYTAKFTAGPPAAPTDGEACVVRVD